MTNETNLKSLNDRTKEEREEIARKGGQKSGEVRRQRKFFKDAVQEILSIPLTNEDTKNKLKKLGVKKEDLNNQTALIISVLQNGIKKGDYKVLEILRDTVGEKPIEKTALEHSGNINNPFEGLSTEELRKVLNEWTNYSTS